MEGGVRYRGCVRAGMVRSGPAMFALFCLLFYVSNTIGHRILLPVTSGFHTPSHVKLITTISKALVDKGHHVTLLRWTGWENYANDSFSEVIVYSGCFTKEESEEYNEKSSQQFSVSASGFSEMVRNLLEMKHVFARCCGDMWADKRALQELENGHYDLTLVFYLSTCNGMVAQYLGHPFVVFTSTVRVPLLDETLFGMPIPSSYVPFDIFSTLTDEMTFFERLQNFVSFYVDYLAMYVTTDTLVKTQQEYNIKPELNQKQLFADALLWLTNVDVTLDFARPFTPNVIPIGGVMVTKEKPLREDLIEFLDGAGENGVVICSLGSAVKSLGDKQTALMLNTFNGLKQRVLWKFEGTLPSGVAVGENIRIVKWMPQNDLLAHPQVKLMIYHGGVNGVYEAIYHGVPMVLLPLFADQFFTSTRIQKKGMGVMLDVLQITEESFREAVNTVLHDRRYQKNADRLSAIYRDLNKNQSPLERAVYWIDHVLQFGGDHLRPRSADMGTIELYSLDVAAFIIIMVVILSVISFVTLRGILKCLYGCWCYCCCCRKTSSASEGSTTVGDSKKKK
ncbi:UDP-glucuronosyltransferase 1A10-like [Apostichopus japonicus]|uniref:UDP-glucuronosyltransferase 1A10-like n=1 Tax=Stichopus japonicus TaxID=307972 RepID=UPI003AB2A74A